MKFALYDCPTPPARSCRPSSWLLFSCLLSGCLSLGASASGAQQVTVVQTTQDLTQTLQTQPALSFSSKPRPTSVNTASPSVLVDDQQHFQTMDGFGASLTDAAAWLLEEKLSPAARDQVMVRLFDPERGAGLSFLRQPIGSTDLSRNLYSFDDVPAGEQDPQLQHFSTRHDDAYIFPAIRQALRLNPRITIMATPWSPPAWMKTHDSEFGGSLRTDAMPSYGAYLVRSLQAFAAAGVTVKYLSVQNEPLNETHDYPGTLMPATQQADFIAKDLGPGLRRAGLSTSILAYDHNWDHSEYPLQVLSDPAAAQYVAGSALHCYGGDVSAQNLIHDRFPNKGIWLTECSGGSWQQESPLLATAHLLIASTRAWAKSVVLWGIATDSDHGPYAGGCKTCRGLVTINLHANPPVVTYNGDFYGLAQASKFVPPGAKRIASTQPPHSSLETVAFQNPDSSITLLVLNNASAPVAFQLEWHGLTASASVPARALATFHWQPGH